MRRIPLGQNTLIDKYLVRLKEMREKFASAQTWEELASMLLEALHSFLPISEASLTLLEKAPGMQGLSKQWREEGRPVDQEQQVTRLELAHHGQVLGWMDLWVHPRQIIQQEQFQILDNLGSEMSLAIEVFRLRAWYQSHSKSIEAERQQMARHLHDTLAHDLAYLLLKLDQFSSYPSRVSSDTFLQEASRLRDIAQRAYEQVRNILSELQEKPAQSLCSGIQECIEAANHRAQLKIELSISGEEIAIPPHQARQILLVIREALRNIEKHANAKKGFVHLDWMENALMVEINDNGQGLELDRGRRGEDNYGLRFIQQAVEEWNGKFTISSSNTSGTRLNFYIPIEK